MRSMSKARIISVNPDEARKLNQLYYLYTRYETILKKDKKFNKLDDETKLDFTLKYIEYRIKFFSYKIDFEKKYLSGIIHDGYETDIMNMIIKVFIREE